MSEQVTPADLRAAMTEVEQLGFEGHDLASLPSVTDRIDGEMSEDWADKADRFAVAAPAIDRLADYMLEGFGPDTHFKCESFLPGFSIGESMYYSLREPFLAARQDPELDEDIRKGVDQFDTISNRQETPELSGQGLLKGADYPGEMSEHLVVLADMIAKHQEASLLDKADKVNIARQILPRNIGRLASLHVDDFRHVGGLSELQKAGEVTLLQPHPGRWVLDVGGKMSAAAARAHKQALRDEQLQEAFRNAETIEIPVYVEPEVDDMPDAPNTVIGKLLRKVRSLGWLGTKAEVQVEEEMPTVPEPIELEVEKVDEAEPEHSTPALVCPAHHRQKRGSDTALERFVYAGINLGAEFGLFDDDFDVHKRPDFTKISGI